MKVLFNKRKLALASIPLLLSCGELKPKPCSVEETAEGSLITCPNGTESLVKNGQGEAGPKGETGQAGSAGDKGEVGPKGETGLPAVPGANWAMYSGTTRVGKILTNPLDAGFTTQVQNDPTIVEIEPHTYGYAYIDRVAQGRFTSITRQCLYESNDCTGTCLLDATRFTIVDTSLRKPIVLFQLGDDDLTSTLISFDLAAGPVTKTLGSWNQLSAACVSFPSTMPVYTSSPYTLPTGLSYPISTPNFKVE